MKTIKELEKEIDILVNKETELQAKDIYSGDLVRITIKLQNLYPLLEQTKAIKKMIKKEEIEDGGFDLVNAEESSVWAEGFESGQENFKDKLLSKIEER
ncbi:MAG: hypothetical protein IH948_00125 [Bacteroidetes bacterium]|nr:hypothetical protein [Bacteroidota bacterium]